MRGREVAPLQNTTVEGGVARIWTWETCNEFGFYQTCEVGSKCFFTQGYDTLNASVRSCAKEFGVGEAKLYENIVRPLSFLTSSSVISV